MSRNSRNLLRIHYTRQSKRTSLIDKIWTMHYVLRTAINKVSSQKVENSLGMLRPCFSKKAEFVAGGVHLQILSRFGLWPLSTWPIFRKNHSKLPSNHHDHHAAASQNHNFTLVFWHRVWLLKITSWPSTFSSVPRRCYWSLEVHELGFSRRCWDTVLPKLCWFEWDWKDVLKRGSCVFFVWEVPCCNRSTSPNHPSRQQHLSH